MMKSYEIVKELKIEAVNVDAVHAFLSKIPTLEIKSIQREKNIGSGRCVDGMIRLENDDRELAMIIEVKKQGSTLIRPFCNLPTTRPHDLYEPIRVRSKHSASRPDVGNSVPIFRGAGDL